MVIMISPSIGFWQNLFNQYGHRLLCTGTFIALCVRVPALLLDPPWVDSNVAIINVTDLQTSLYDVDNCVDTTRSSTIHLGSRRIAKSACPQRHHDDQARPSNMFADYHAGCSLEEEINNAKNPPQTVEEEEDEPVAKA